MSGAFSHAWLQGLFADPETAEILSPQADLKRFRQIEVAWLYARCAVGHIDAQLCADAAAHVARCTIDFDLLRIGTAADGLPIPAFVRALIANASDAEKAVIHKGLTSQDVLDTALVLALQSLLGVYSTRLRNIQVTLARLSDENTDRELMGYTRMQAALPIAAQNRIAVWSQPLDRYLDQICPLRDHLSVLQWGGPVGIRDTPYAPALGAAFAARLHLRDPGHAWHSTRHDIADLAGWLARVTGSLGKIGQDIALMAQRGAADITMQSGGTSSAMPYKQNPILAELLQTLAHYNSTQLSNMHVAMLHEQERSGTAWTLEFMTLPDMLQTCGRSLTATQDLLRQIVSIGIPKG